MHMTEEAGGDSALRCPRLVQRRNFRTIPPALRGRGRRGVPATIISHVHNPGRLTFQTLRPARNQAGFATQMKNFRNTLPLLLTAVLFSFSALADDRQELNFNPGWKFIKASPTNAQLPGFNDRRWTTVSTPHTFNDVDTFDNFALPGLRGETNQWSGRTWYRKTFDAPESWQGKKIYIEFEAVRQVAEVYLNGHLLGACKNGFIPFGFDLTPYLQTGRPNVLAVMCDNGFIFNPMKPATNTTASAKGGKTASAKKAAVSTATNATNTAENVAQPERRRRRSRDGDSGTNGTAIENLLSVQAKVNANVPMNVDDLKAGQIPWNSPQWHPAMGGIYRDVKLFVVDPLHISLPLYDFLKTEGPYVYSTNISETSATVTVEVPVENGRTSDEQVEVGVQILDRDGKALFSDHLAPVVKIAAGASDKSKLSFVVPNPQLWEPDYPYLYRAKIVLSAGGRIVDSQEIPFGIRAVHWDVKTGFWINGNHLKLHGWGQKPLDEWPGLGDAMPDWMHFYTLDLMKEAGGNWVRWGHCAGGPAEIESCDELGMMVEQPGVDGESDTVRAAWKVRAAAFRDAIIFYRNDPSIMIWEGGNQKVTAAHAKELRGYFDEYDPHGGRAYAHRRADKTTGEFMDVTIGTEGSHEVPRLPVVEGEYDREESPRRVWDEFTPPNTNYDAMQKAAQQTYAEDSEQYAVNEVKNYVHKVGASNHSGGANWIFSDSTSGGRNTTEVDRASGEVDGVRLPKEAYYVCQAMFRDDPQVHIIGHWNYPAGTKKDIYVASNCGDVELFVNGKLLGHGKVSNHYLFTFTNVVFEPGEIEAVACNDGVAVATNSIHTAGAPVALRLTPITGPDGWLANGSDIALIDVEAVDANGERCPTVQQRVNFTCTGPAIWRGGYDSGKTNSINNKYLDLEAGINRVAVRSILKPGAVTITAKSHGLKSASITIHSELFPRDDGFATALPDLPKTALPETHAAWTNLTEPVPPITTTAMSGNEAMAGRFTESFAYTGPTEGARVQTNAADGGKIYSDADFMFTNLPEELAGADWVQVPDADSLYSAADLMQLVVQGGTEVYIAHDDRLPTTEWLTNQFKLATNLSITVNNLPMRLFHHSAKEEGSITLGSNTEDASVKEANAYIVFVNGASPAKTNETDKAATKNEDEKTDASQ
jgi:beta-galactosidase